MPARSLIFLLPVLGFLAAAAAFLWGLNPQRNPSEVPSALIDDPIPEFVLPPLEGVGVPGFSSTELRTGQVALVNVFASWCVPCRAEHPSLMRLAEHGIAPIYGINYKDNKDDAVGWLAELGNPYVAIGADKNGRVAIDWGIYGVPETFVIDRGGVIRYRHVGPVLPAVFEEDILPLVKSLQQEAQ